MPKEKKRVAVIGAGVSGLVAAWGISRSHDTTLFEANDYLGGHSNTVTIISEPNVQVDTGFIVYNELNYPNFSALLRHLGVATQASDMSFAVSLDDGNFEYSTGTLASLFGSVTQFRKKRFWALMLGLVRLYGPSGYRTQRPSPGQTIGDFLRVQGFSESFICDHVLPMTAAIWSSSIEDAYKYPADSFISFFKNHRLLSLFERPRWRTITGGSKEYINKLVADGKFEIRMTCRVDSVRRLSDRIELIDETGSTSYYDEVIFATHADKALAILVDPSHDERRILGSVRYSKNIAILHEDIRQMPSEKKFWSSWNYVRKGLGEDKKVPVFVTYWMNRLHRLGLKRQLFVTLNSVGNIDDSLIHYQAEYSHPIINTESISAARQSIAIQGVNRSWFCGAYLGDGFHEDGVQSGLWIANRIDSSRSHFIPATFNRLPVDYQRMNVSV